jgi:hypothetical protein
LNSEHHNILKAKPLKATLKAKSLLKANLESKIIVESKKLSPDAASLHRKALNSLVK